MSTVYLDAVKMAPDPYSTSVTVSWEGLNFTGSSYIWQKQLRLMWSMSPDNVNWTSLNDISNPIIHYATDLYGSFAINPPAEVPYGYYLRLACFGAAHNNRVPPSWNTSPYRYATIRKISPTAVSAPTACAVNATVSEGNVTLSWSGAAAGTGNAINGFEVQYSDSSNGSSWGGWAALTTVNTSSGNGSVSVSPPGTRGHYRRFQVRTRTANAAYNSGWKVSTNTLRRNTLPGAPTVFTAKPDSYITENITLAWSGAAAGTSAIKQYVIQKQESTDGKVTWGAWSNVATITSSATSGSTTVTPTRVLDVYTQYRICAQDTLNCISGYKGSNAVYSIALPFAPVINVPKAGATTYNRNPLILIETQAAPGGKPQTVFVRAPDGRTYNSVDHPAMFSRSGAQTGAVKTVFTCPALGDGTFSVSVYCRTVGDGPAVSRSFSSAVFSMETITANVTPVRAAHITTLRGAVNSLRNYYGLGAYGWQDTITAGKTAIAYWPYHVQELHKAIQPVIDMLAAYGVNPSKMRIDWIPLGTGRPRADVMNQLRESVLLL